MFLLLHGTVGVVLGQDWKCKTRASISSSLTIGPGEIVGERAFILRRPRTATLVSLSRTAILSFNYAQVETLTKQNTRYGRKVKASIDAFVTERVLEHVRHNGLTSLAKTRPDHRARSMTRLAMNSSMKRV